MSKIKAVARDKKLIITSRPVLTSGSKNIDGFSVVFDKTWNFDSADYYVNFFIDDDKNGVIRHLDVSGNVGRCDIPFYITRNEGFFHFGVFAKADGDIVKTSDIVGYEVKRGICVEPDGDEHDTVTEIKKLFIDMINNNIYGGVLTYDMRFEDIELNFCEYINAFSEDMIIVGNLNESFYDVIKTHINSDIQRISAPKDALASYISVLREYFDEDSLQIEFNSINDEAQKLNGLKSGICGLIKTYIDPDFNEDSDFIIYLTTIEEYLEDAAEAAECSDTIISNLYSLYTGGN